MGLLTLGFTLFFCINVALGQQVDYTGHAIIRTRAVDQTQLTFLRRLQQADSTLDFWTEPWRVDIPVDIHVQPDHIDSLVHTLNSGGLKHHFKVKDLEQAIREERRLIELRRELTKNQKAFDYTNYHTYNEIQSYLLQLAAENPLVSYSTVGTTYEGRGLGMATISTMSDPGKPLIFFDCGVHAREWAAPTTCLWFIDQLASNYGTDSEITRLLDAFDWKIIPSSNPDGYDFSWNSNRLWRRNRSRNNGTTCIGVDINRNFDINFGGSGSSNFCGDTYHGPNSFSEAESSAIRDVLASERPRVKAAVSIHTYSQLWMSPYGYTNTLPSNYNELLRVMQAGVTALQNTYGTRYMFGNHADTIYIASGVTLDHAYVAENITYSYLLELRDTGSYGFELPPSLIEVTAIETWNGIKAMAFAILEAA